VRAEAQTDDIADWQALARRWTHAPSSFRQPMRTVSEWLVARLEPGPGETILELAAGTGETGFQAAAHLEPGGVLISSDRSPNMVETARRRAGELGIGNVAFRVLDSAQLELPDASVDGVISRFGYILRGHPPPALSEVRRVLRREGRLVFAVWAERARNSWITIPADVMVERGHLAAPSAEELRLSERRNPAGIARLLEQAGFALAAIDEIAVSYRFADAGELWFFVSELRGRLALTLDGLGEDERLCVRSEIEERAAVFGGGFELGGITLNVLAE
jgi:SAM-dependent methyltransferase